MEINFFRKFFLVWLDMRTACTVDAILAKGKKKKNFLKSQCGLPVSTYFSAVKLKWLIDNVPEVKLAIEENRCMFGTIDTWLIWVRLEHFQKKSRFNINFVFRI